MSENQNQEIDQSNDQEANQNDNESSKSKPEAKGEADRLSELVKQQVEDQLKDIKQKLNNAYGARDEALKKVAEFEQARKEAELKRLQEEGKHKEAYELQLAEEKAKREAVERRNIELTRDIEVRDALKGYSFRNDSATEMAYREIVTQLIQSENGVWVHKSGISIRDFVKAFSDNEDNSFLFKPKVSSGSGSTSSKGTSNSSNDKAKSLFDLSQEEVLKLAQEGKLPKRT